MQILTVNGPAVLRGSVPVSGAKNSVLPILAATLAVQGTCVLHNCPEIDDVENTVRILRHLGCRVERSGKTLTVDPQFAEGWEVPAEAAGKMRSSVLFLGALLTRCKRARLAMPGGCPLGARPVDMHISAVTALGAQVCICRQGLEARAEGLRGRTVMLPFPSVGATENTILAALGAEGTVRIENAAREPEITDLIRFLQGAGAEIRGEGTAVLEITGGIRLHGTTHTILPDRIETATFLCAAAACGGDVTLTGTGGQEARSVVELLEGAGCEITCRADSVHICSDGCLLAPPLVVTAPYPGFPTDAQAPAMAAFARAKGQSVFEETIFDDRFRHVPELCRMGADIAFCGSRACLRGVGALHGASVCAADLRGGAALVIAALQAEGKTDVAGVKHIKRGYDNLDGKLQSLGADVKYVEISKPIVYNRS